MTVIRWNIKAFEQLRRDPRITRELEKHAEQIASRANSNATENAKGDYVVETGRGRTRNRASVVTGSEAAKADNADDHTLLRALGGGA